MSCSERLQRTSARAGGGLAYPLPETSPAINTSKQIGTEVIIEADDHVIQTKMLDSLKQSGSRIIPAAKVVKAVSGPKYNWKYLHMIVQEKLGDAFACLLVHAHSHHADSMLCALLGSSSCQLLASVTKMIGALTGPKYDGKYQHKLLGEKLGTRGLHETLINVKRKLELDAMLLDVCISTSAALTYLPEHYFETKDQDGKVQELNMIDGGVAATNLTLVVMGEVTKAITEGCSDFFAIQPMDCMRFLVISLGSGSGK
ncbi:hypothetical protein CRG98_046210 [Punica granatum]|uniref:PNPLA domain-containing protein n=1 Tax=Punica granatum TaxID=22663 RepID=A0A2I0HNW8_PUNGR|nr:hypothetical protein CRG98_046210 [Punica granatum]